MKRAMRAASYIAAPKMAFAAFNPRKAAVLKAGQWAMSRVRPQPRKPALGALALKGFGAAALAVPVGMWLGRRSRGESERQEI